MMLDDEVAANYLRSRDAFLSGDINMATFWYRKNRTEHSIELFYEIDLPSPIKFVHPLGAVLGRATYAPHLVIYQGSGVGSDIDGNRPEFTGPAVLFPGSRILGKTKIGANCWITANTVVQNINIPDNSIVYPHSPQWGKLGASILTCQWRSTHRSVRAHFFPESE